MANSEHLKILEQGIKVWNKWRVENKGIKPDLRNLYLRGENLSASFFSGANFFNTNLSNVNFYAADLSDANFFLADLSNADLSFANLNGADISFASLLSAYLYHAKFGNANFFKTRMGRTVIGDVDFSETNNLETVVHRGPSLISINTIYESRGNIPEKFLRGCGVPEDFITYMRSLTGKAIEFYSCFISFTEADDILSERLYNDMQAAGIRCWRWKEDAKWGRTLMRSIDEAVRVYDKLVVICSEQSLNSPAVIREIERALQKEDDAAREGKEGEVLFPIRLDDFIFAGWEHHRKADVVAKNVGDFRRWTEPVEYKKAFKRLMRDLKAGERR